MKKRQTGITLIELVVVILVITIISTMAAPLMKRISEALEYQYSASTIEDQARIGLTRIGRELREIRSINDFTPAANTITFTNLSDTVIAYTLSGTNLQRNGNTLTSSVTAFNLSYYDSNGAVTTSTSNIRYIKITLTITNNSNSETFETTVFPRSFA